MAWASTYTASGTYSNTGTAAASAAITFTPALPGIPSGASGGLWILQTSGGTNTGYAPTGGMTAIASNSAALVGVIPGTSGQLYAIFGHSIIA